MRFVARLLLLAFVLLAVFDSVSGSPGNDPWFKPNPQTRSSQYHARSRLGGSRLLPRRMYRSLNNYEYNMPANEINDITDSE